MKKIVILSGLFLLLAALNLGMAGAQQSTPQTGQATEWVCPRTGEVVKAGQGPCCGQQVRHRGGRKGKMGYPGRGMQGPAAPSDTSAPAKP